MQIGNVIFAETGSYHDMWVRGYKTHATEATLGMLAQATDGGREVNLNALSSVSGHFLSPSSQVESPIQIPNGWESGRFRFFMTVHHTSATIPGGERIDILTGYTNHPGANQSGSIDPRMELYFNGMTVVNCIPRVTQDGRRVIDHSVTEDCQILPGYFDAMRKESTGYFLRPTDILEGMVLTTAFPNEDYKTHDTRQFTISEPRLSRRHNNHPGDVLTRLLTQYNASLTSANRHNSTYASILTNAKRSPDIAEPVVNQSMTLSELSKRSGLKERRFVQWGELLSMSPGLDDRTYVNFINRKAQQAGMEACRANSQSMVGVGYDVLAAVNIQNILPSIMVQTNLINVKLIMTNDTLGGRYATTPQHVAHVCQLVTRDRIDSRRNVNALVARINNEIMPLITRNGEIKITATVSCDLLGDTRISMSYNGSPEVPYDIPQWCDAHMAPTITTDRNRRNNISTCVDAMFNAIKD